MRTIRRTIGTVFAILAVIGLTVLLNSGSRAATLDDLQKAPEAQKSAACTLKVTGMTCGGCAAAVKSAAKKVDGVKGANVSYEKGLAEVTYDPEKTTPAAIAKAVTEKSGFKAEVVSSPAAKSDRTALTVEGLPRRGTHL